MVKDEKGKLVAQCKFLRAFQAYTNPVSHITFTI